MGAGCGENEAGLLGGGAVLGGPGRELGLFRGGGFAGRRAGVWGAVIVGAASVGGDEEAGISRPSRGRVSQGAAFPRGGAL